MNSHNKFGIINFIKLILINNFFYCTHKMGTISCTTALCCLQHCENKSNKIDCVIKCCNNNNFNDQQKIICSRFILNNSQPVFP